MSLRRYEKPLTTAATVVCVVMLALIGARLYTLLGAPARTDGARAPFADDISANGLPGIVLIDIADDAAATAYHVPSPGVYVLAVDEASGAYVAGVRSGDRVISMNGAPVALSDELRAYAGELTLVVSRGGETVTVRLDTGSSI